MRTPRAVAFTAAALTLLGLVAACSKNTGQNEGNTTAPIISAGIATNPKQSQGPAEPIKGAKRGGTLYVLEESDFEHLDPARIYVSDSSSVTQLLVRTLTMLKQDPKTGKNVLVGDLATNTGKDVKGDGTVWQYTLKKGLKYEDGTPIKAEDVAYAVGRSFSPNLAEGPHYLQQWLTGTQAYNADYKGPYDGGKAMPPGVTVKGDTITFHLKKPEPDLPYAVSWGNTAPIPQSKDSDPQAIDTHPFSSGPYKIESYKHGSDLVAVRNKFWDAKTDPIRHDYFDKLVWENGPTGDQQTNRLIAQNGNDQYAVSFDGVSPELTPRVTGDSSLQPREIAGFLPYASRIDINTQRVTDVNVRKALNYAYNRDAYVKARGGSAQGQASHQMMSPTVTGFKDYNAYPSKNDQGNVAKAKQLLNGKHPHLVYAYPNEAEYEKLSPVVKSSLERAGFRVTLRAIDSDSYFTIVGRKNNPYDMYIVNWGADWPSGSTVIPPLFDGRTIAPSGNVNTSYINEPAINKEIDRIDKLPAEKASKEWGNLDEMIMKQYAPAIPTFDYKILTLRGDKVGGVLLGTGNIGGPIFYDAYLK